jgi:hypothetical protein
MATPRSSRHLAAVPDPAPPVEPAVDTVLVWLRERTAVHGVYPCRCRQNRRCEVLWCRCAGRVDLDQVPRWCCARVNTPAVWKAAYDASERAKAAKGTKAAGE